MLSWGHLGRSLIVPRAILGHTRVILGLFWENLEATWVQGQLVEMPKPLSLGPRAAKTLAWQYTSAHMTSCKMEMLILHRLEAWNFLILPVFFLLFQGGGARGPLRI